MNRPGLKTTEFWLTVAVIFLTQLGTLDVPERFEWVVTVGALVGYAISRGLAKYDVFEDRPLTNLAGILRDNESMARNRPESPPAHNPFDAEKSQSFAGKVTWMGGVPCSGGPHNPPPVETEADAVHSVDPVGRAVKAYEEAAERDREDGGRESEVRSAARQRRYNPRERN